MTGMRRIARSSVQYLPRRLRDRFESWKTRLDTRRGIRLVPASDLEHCYRSALQLLVDRLGREALGDYLEFGVYTGTSLACMHRAVVDVGVASMRLFGFDSFEGLPDEAATDDAGIWRPGQFHSDYAFTRECLTREGIDWTRVFLIKGWYRDTLTPDLIRKHRMSKASVIMVDCDLYSSAQTALAFCAPLIRDQCVIVFDDWYSHGLADRLLGERRAFEEFLHAYPFEAEECAAYPGCSKAFLVQRRSQGSTSRAPWFSA